MLFTFGSGEDGRVQIAGITCNSHFLFFVTERNVFVPYLEHKIKALLQYRPLIIFISTLIRATTNICTIISVMHSSAKIFEATQMSFSQPTAVSHLYSIHTVLRKHVWMEIDTKAVIV